MIAQYQHNQKKHQIHNPFNYHYNHHKKPLHPPIINHKSTLRDHFSTSSSPKKDSLTPRKYSLKKTSSKLFQKAHETDNG